jgi:hypothetical protein
MLFRTPAPARANRTRRRSARRSQFRRGERRAVRQALTAARLRLGHPIKATSLAEAAEAAGSSVHYVEAAVWVLEAEDVVLLADVLAGGKPLLAAGAQARHRAALITAFRKASPHDRAVSGSTIGIDAVFDTMVVPSL